MTISLVGLYIYPIKSIRAVALTKSNLDRWGLQYDRRYMLVDSQGRFISQRQQARMALIQPLPIASGWQLSAPGIDDIFLPFELSAGKACRVTVWEDECAAIEASTELSNWFQAFLKVDAKLVYFPDSSQRQVDLEYAKPGTQVSFSDGFPVLLAQTASLDKLNAEMSLPVDMLRFRPNIVVSGADAFAEDQWKYIKIGSIDFDVVKPCSRCVIPSIEIATGERGQQPILEVLKNKRRAVDGKVYFGQNLIHRTEGQLQCGDEVFVF